MLQVAVRKVNMTGGKEFYRAKKKFEGAKINFLISQILVFKGENLQFATATDYFLGPWFKN